METLAVDHKSLDISGKYLNTDASLIGQWVRKELPLSLGKTEFLTARICHNLSLTHSKCEFESHYRCTIRHPDPTTLLIFGLKGYSTFGFSAKKLSYTVRPGDVWLINLDETPLYRFTPANVDNEMVVIKYATDRLSQAFCDDSVAGPGILTSTQILRLGHQESVLFWVENLLNNCLSNATDRLLAESQALELIARWISPAVPVLKTNTVDISEKDLQSLNDVINYLVGDLARTPSLMELAKSAGMSHTKLNRYFKKIYGTTVFSWLRSYRLERSRQYLQDRSRSITHIAFQCGFSSASHFAQAFKEEYQCTPVEFRQQYRAYN